MGLRDLTRDDDPAPPWTDVLDFVGRIAGVLKLSGWSLGVLEAGELHTYNRGFGREISDRYAVLQPEVHLPGPATVQTGRDQYFASRSEAHQSYPLAAGIDDGSRHHAAAVLSLRSRSGAAWGYFALHFDDVQTFDHHSRDRLRRLAASIEAIAPDDPGAADAMQARRA